MFNAFFNILFPKPKNKQNTIHQKTSVPEFLLKNLIYFNDGEEKTLPSNNLTIDDLKKLITQIDFSNLLHQKKEKVLQDILIISHLSPVISKLFKNKIIPADIQIDKDLSVLGKIKEKPTSKEAHNTILLPPDFKTATFIHEYLHLKQGCDGVFNFNHLFPIVHKMAEAHAKGADFIIAARLNYFMSKAYSFYSPDKNLSFVDKIISKRYNLKKHLFQSKREAICYAEEETIGILMKCLLTHKKEHRRQILNNFVPNTLKEFDISSINNYAKNWRFDYSVDTEYKNLDLTNQSLQQELKKITFVNAYYTNLTHIPISCINLKIKGQKIPIDTYLKKQNYQKTK